MIYETPQDLKMRLRSSKSHFLDKLHFYYYYQLTILSSQFFNTEYPLHLHLILLSMIRGPPLLASQTPLNSQEIEHTSYVSKQTLSQQHWEQSLSIIKHVKLLHSLSYITHINIIKKILVTPKLGQSANQAQ